MFIVLVVLIAIILYQLFNVWRCKIKRFKSLENYPGPSAIEVVKVLFSSKPSAEKHKYLMSLNKKYGPVVKIWIKPFTPILQVTDVNFFEKILLSRQHLERSELYEIFKPYGDNLGTADVESWKKYRKIIKPAFSTKQMETTTFPIIIKYTEELIDHIRESLNERIDIQPLLNLATLDMIFAALTGYRTNFLSNQNSHFLDARKEFFEVLALRMYSPLLLQKFILKLTKYYKQMTESMALMKSFSNKIITERINGIRQNENFLDFFINANESKGAIQGNLDLTILGGHDTITSAISFICYELASRPWLQEKILNETNDVMEELNETTITPRVISRLKHLESATRESMRLHDIVAMIERVAGVDVDVDGVKIPAGTRVAFNFEGVHHSDVYYADPYVFRPERFLPENSHELTPNTFCAFSLGPRDCVGKAYAYMAIKTIVIKLLIEFEMVAVTPKHVLEIEPEFSGKSKNGVPLIFKVRCKN